MNHQMALKLLLCFATTVALCLALLFYGESGLNFSDGLILWQLRFPKVIVAFFAGGLLAAAGMMLQVFFQNPLAGPDLLGINAGASLGIAFSMLGASFMTGWMHRIASPLMAMAGAMSVFAVLIFLVNRNMSRVTILIIGLLIGSFSSSIINVLINMSPSLQVKNYFIWGMGTFQGVPLEELPLFIILSLLGLALLFLLPKKLNLMALGEDYARSMGLAVRPFKIQLVFIASFVVALMTIYCGPIAFIGIIAPYLARAFFRQSDARIILPAAFLMGSTLALLTEAVLIFSSDYSLSTNSLLGIIGAPLIGLYLYRSRRSL